MPWNSEKLKEYGAFHAIARIVEKLVREDADFPRFDGVKDNLHLFSDYGSEREGTVQSYSYLVAAEEAVIRAALRFKDFRAKRKDLAQRAMEYKSLGDKIRFRHLPAFLSVADGINGVSVNFCVHRTAKTLLFGSGYSDDIARENLSIRGGIKPAVTERALRIMAFGGLLAGGFGAEGQNVYWTSDHDEFTQTREISDAFREARGHIFNHFAVTKMGDLRFDSILHIDNADYLTRDLITVCDLISGFHVSYWNRRKEGRFDLNPKDGQIHRWLGRGRCDLRKISIYIDRDKENNLCVHRYQVRTGE